MALHSVYSAQPDSTAHRSSKQTRPTGSLVLAAACAASLLLLGVLVKNRTQQLQQWQRQAGPDTAATVALGSASVCAPPQPLPPIKTRQAIGILLQQEKLEVGVELGVQHGAFAAETLSHWPHCKKFYLVDIWAPQQNYKDFANVPAEQQAQAMAAARATLAPYSTKTVWMRALTTEAARRIARDGLGRQAKPLDYVYVDARHDFCGVMEDIQAYWPLIRPGGIMAGHDFENAPDVMAQSGQDWSLCANGTISQGAVQGAVLEFFEAQGLQVSVTYRESAWNSWLVRKPEPCYAAQVAAAHAAAASAAARPKSKGAQADLPGTAAGSGGGGDIGAAAMTSNTDRLQAQQ